MLMPFCFYRVLAYLGDNIFKETHLYEFLTPRVGRIHLDDIVTLELGYQMSRGSFTDSWRAADKNSSIDSKTILSRFLEAVFVQFRPGFEPVAEPFNVGLVSADLLQVCWCVLGCPKLRRGGWRCSVRQGRFSNAERSQSDVGTDLTAVPVLPSTFAFLCSRASFSFSLFSISNAAFFIAC